MFFFLPGLNHTKQRIKYPAKGNDSDSGVSNWQPFNPKSGMLPSEPMCQFSFLNNSLRISNRLDY